MIKLQREPEPQKLINNKPDWLKALREAIVRYGGYDKLGEIKIEFLEWLIKN